MVGPVRSDARGEGRRLPPRRGGRLARAEAEGARWLAVSNVEEGCVLRQAGTQSRILVMADFLEDEREMLATHHLTPVIHSLEDLSAVRVPYHLKIDTGMNRLGTRATPDEIARAVAAAPAPLEGLMTHFASSGNYDSKRDRATAPMFRKCDPGIAPRRNHAASMHSSSHPRRALLSSPARGLGQPGGRAISSTVMFLRPKARRSRCWMWLRP